MPVLSLVHGGANEVTRTPIGEARGTPKGRNVAADTAGPYVALLQHPWAAPEEALDYTLSVYDGQSAETCQPGTAP